VKVAVSADNPRSLSSLAFPRILAETDRGNVGLIDLAVASFCFVVFLLLFVARLWPPRASFQICGIKGVVLLHNDTLGAASGLLLAMVHIHRLGRAIGARETAAAGGVALHLAVVSSDLANNVVKGLLNIQTRLGGSLDELAAERTSQSLSLLPGDLTLALEIALVADDNHGEVVLVLDSQNLLLEGGDFLEALAGCDGVDEEETLSGPHVLLAHGAVLLLASGVEDIEQSGLIIDVALLAV
jgi:hypothetical protein